MAIDLAFVLSNLFFFFLFLAAESCVWSHEREDCKTGKEKKKERQKKQRVFVCVRVCV